MCSDHCLEDIYRLKKILKKNFEKKNLWKFFWDHQILYGISIPGGHVIMRDCMDFQCMVKKFFAKKIFFSNFFFQFFFLLLLIHSGKNVPDYVKFLQA